MTLAIPDSLRATARTLASTPIAALFARDPSRVERLTFEWEGFRVDLAKERITPEALAELCAHAGGAGLGRWIAALFAGEKVNVSEARPALHPALRDPSTTPLSVDGADLRRDIRVSRERIGAIADAIRRGDRCGATGKPIRHLVHMGIGGSDLGPRLVVDALSPGTPVEGPGVSFVANVDPVALDRALAPLDPASTAFVVASKSFSTQETLVNANAALAWLAAALPPSADTHAHLIAATARPQAAAEFGVPADAILPFHESVGGRFSLWSSVGVTIAAALGNRVHAELLAGAHAMDRHFATAPFAANLPVVLALAGLWNASALGYRQRIVVPYAEALAHLPTYLQQLSLESNGKRVTRDGSPVEGRTAPALWGGIGTDGQHAFFQWLHQGTDVAPVEFVVPAVPVRGDARRHALLVANALAQSQALALGRTSDDVAADLARRGAPVDASSVAARACPGDRPSTTILTPRLDARTLGSLLALYEHRTFVEGVLWGINPFDQFGVELGKMLADPIAAALAGDGELAAGADASTRALVAHVHAMMNSGSEP
ncbi:glucose-6-phosphate isomerase [Burkholderiales bacterium]|nr:glucose-6-phosphate isomerase [Burkholderiales bacterium]